MNLVKPNGKIVAPHFIGDDRLEVGTDLAGNFLFSVNGQTIRMTPRQTFDLAQRLLTALGIQLEKVEPDLPGEKLAG